MHLSGCPAGGWGGCYAHCTCDQIRLREHTQELSRFNELASQVDLASLVEKIADLEERVRQLENTKAGAGGGA